MKFAIGIIAFFWLLSGLIGAWRLDEFRAADWKAVAKGPITLAKAFNDRPVTYPGPD
jgi:hypothetical protein